ncbi:sterol 26-hydroxylase, mitochondrial-like [Oncorhynchus tshawytscha]|uniref:Sterol 26-hydroxylase, mitochondrial-like n=1 Tax=Oncorhynchus tshawytscha TaxID=74940 RepID=A0A8C8D0T5_ONCTS|nr:sterol 26-hydroxylase, mitochondrial-like [Oncorhynchus tshawytscha]
MAVHLAQSAMQRSGRWLLLCSTAPALVSTRWVGGTRSPSNTLPSTSQGKIRTADDLPRIKTRDMFYRMFVKGYYNRLHELQVYEKQLYGPMYKMGMGTFHSIALNSVELLEELLRKGEKFPSRGDMSLWTEYRDLRGIGYGPFTEEGEKWYKLRTVLNKRMMHPKDSVQYGDVVNEVVSDLIKRIYHLRRISPSGDLVTNLSNELYRFSLEGISSILFETRIGCLEEEIPVETQDFIDSIAQMFSYSMPVAMLPKWSRNILPIYRHYIAGWEGIFKFSGKLIDMKMEAIQKRVDTDQEVEGEYLTYLLSNTKMTNKEVYGSVTELLLAGVDTTSNTMMWAMHLLSRYPNEQDILYQEVSHCVPGDKIPSAQDVNRMPYLKAVIKEALRMYPVVPMNARIMVENDIIIGGHFFPKKTSFTMCHYATSQDEKTFPEPSKFKPERWLRDGRVRPNPFGSIPFGFGVRGCVGRRIAELEMYLAMSRIIKLFEIRPDPSIGEVKALNRTVLVADRQVNLHFVERTNRAAL